MKEILAQIAKYHLGIHTLEDQHHDAVDFHDLAVWNIRAALEAAFEAGIEHAQNQPENPDV